MDIILAILKLKARQKFIELTLYLHKPGDPAFYVLLFSMSLSIPL